VTPVNKLPSKSRLVSVEMQLVEDGVDLLLAKAPLGRQKRANMGVELGIDRFAALTKSYLDKASLPVKVWLKLVGCLIHQASCKRVAIKTLLNRRIVEKIRNGGLARKDGLLVARLSCLSTNFGQQFGPIEGPVPTFMPKLATVATGSKAEGGLNFTVNDVLE
jgi:hypothetical protein